MKKKNKTLRLQHYLDGHLQQDGGGRMCLGLAQIPSLQQRTTTAVKTKTHDPQKQTEGGGEEGEPDWASQDMLMSLMTFPKVAYGRLAAVKQRCLKGFRFPQSPASI